MDFERVESEGGREDGDTWIRVRGRSGSRPRLEYFLFNDDSLKIEWHHDTPGSVGTLMHAYLDPEELAALRALLTDGRLPHDAGKKTRPICMEEGDLPDVADLA